MLIGIGLSISFLIGFYIGVKMTDKELNYKEQNNQDKYE